MQMLFIDESGTPPSLERQDRGSRYFVIAGVVVPEDQWHKLRDQLMGMKIRRKLRGEIKWRHFAPQNEDKTNPMRECSAEERGEVRDEILSMIANNKALRIIACVTSVAAAYETGFISGPEDIYHGTYKPVSERFQYHLQETNSLGIIISDHRGGQDDKRLRLHHQKLLHSSAEFTSNYGNLVESLFFQPSNLSVGIQLADMVAGSVWRAHEKDDARFLDRLTPAFRQSRSGRIEGYGLVKFPKKGWK